MLSLGARASGFRTGPRRASWVGRGHSAATFTTRGPPRARAGCWREPPSFPPGPCFRSPPSARRRHTWNLCSASRARSAHGPLRLRAGLWHGDFRSVHVAVASRWPGSPERARRRGRIHRRGGLCAGRCAMASDGFQPNGCARRACGTQAHMRGASARGVGARASATNTRPCGPINPHGVRAARRHTTLHPSHPPGARGPVRVTGLIFPRRRPTNPRTLTILPLPGLGTQEPGCRGLQHLPTIPACARGQAVSRRLVFAPASGPRPRRVPLHDPFPLVHAHVMVSRGRRRVSRALLQRWVAGGAHRGTALRRRLGAGASPLLGGLLPRQGVHTAAP